MEQHFTTAFLGEQVGHEHVHVALSSAGIGTWDFDPVGNEVIWDARSRELFGFAAAEPLGFDQVFRYADASDAPAIGAALRSAMQPGSGGAFEIRFGVVHAGKGRRRLRCSGRVHFDSDGAVYRMAGIVHEIPAGELAATSGEMAAAAINNPVVGLFRVEVATNTITYSPAFAAILTGEPTPGLGREDFFSHIHPDDAAARIAAYAAAEVSGELHCELRTIWNDGSVHWVRTLGSYSCYDGDRAKVFSGTVQDITAEKKLLADAASAQRLAELAIKSTGLGVFHTDLSNDHATYSPEFAAIFTGNAAQTSLSRQELIDRVHPEDQALRAAALKRALQTGEIKYEPRVIWDDGSVHHLSVNGACIFDDDGKPIALSGTVKDITEQQLQARALREAEEQYVQAQLESEARFRSIVEQAPVAIGVLRGRDMVIEVGNDKMFELWDKERAVTGTKLLDALPELKGQGFLELMRGVFDTGRPFTGKGVPAMLFRKGKLEEGYFDFTYTPLRDADGRVSGIMTLAMEVTEQVTAFRSVEASEARFRSLIEEAPFATALYLGRGLKIDTANEAMISLWGKGSRVVGMELAEALPELEGQPFISILHEVFDTGVAYHAQQAKVDLVVNGVLDSFYFNFTYKPLRDKSGEVYAILNMAVDVTEQVAASKRLEESELFARSIIDNSPVAKLVFIGEELIVHTINQNMLRLLGRDSSIIGLPFRDAVPEFVKTLARLQQVYASGETYVQPEERLEMFWGGQNHVGYYHYIFKALRNTAGEIYGVMATATDITAQVLARQKVEDAEAALRGAIELAELGTWSYDVASGTFTFSDRLQEWFGFEKGETIYSTGYNPIHENDQARINRAIASALNPASGGAYDVEYTLVEYRTGRERICHAQGRTSFDNAGNPIRLSGTTQDVTEQRRIQLALEQQVQERTEELAAMNEELRVMNDELEESNAQLKHSNEELAQYAYVASHDLQEPLRKIRMFSGMLNGQAGLTEDSRQLVAKIAQSSERMSMLINDLLEFSRLLKSERLARPISLNDIVSAVVNDFELSIAESGAAIQIGNLPVVQAIGLQMNQLFYNLVGNALKFSKPGRTPSIVIRAEEISREEAAKHIKKPLSFARYHHISIEDNGIGFEVKYADQIFEVFKRLHGRDMYPGSGIGLALCRRIVDNHHGGIYATSIPGEGTTFHLVLPDKQQDRH